MATTDPVLGPTGPPALSATSSPRGLPMLQDWFRGPARWVGWLVIPLVPLFIFSAAIGFEVFESTCEAGTEQGSRNSSRTVYDQSCVDNGAFGMALLSLFYVLLAVLFLASAYAAVRRPTHSIPASEKLARLQGVKDWFVRGDIPEDDYQGLRQLIEAQDDPTGLGAAARRGASLFRAAAVLLVPAGFFWVIFVSVFAEELARSADEIVFIVNGIGGTLLFVVLFVACIVRAARLSRYGSSFVDASRKRIDEAEEAVMRAARARAGVRDAVPTASGASYRVYSRR